MNNLLFWKMTIRGSRWQRRTSDGIIAGFIQRDKSGAWDAYVCTGRPWPEADQIVNRKWSKKTALRLFHRAKADVECAWIKQCEVATEGGRQ